MPAKSTAGANSTQRQKRPASESTGKGVYPKMSNFRKSASFVVEEIGFVCILCIPLGYRSRAFVHSFLITR